MPPPVRLGIWGVFGRGNFGNEATLAAFLDWLDPAEYEPVLFCEDPDRAAATHGVPARRLGSPADARGGPKPVRAAGTAVNRLLLLRGAVRAARSVDAVVVAGTGGLERYGSGAFGTPFEIWALGRACALTGRPFVLLDVGVERLPRRLARLFVGDAGRVAAYRSYRDAASRSSMVANGLPAAGTDPVVTDLAFGLRPERAPDATQPTVALGVMDYWGRDSSRESSEAVHDRYRNSCAKLVAALQERGFAVRIVGGDDGDLEFAHRLVEDLPDGIAVVEARTPDELVGELSQAHVVIAARYHTLIMALLAGTPAVSVGYGTKHRAMLDQLGLPDEHHDIESFDPETVAAAAAALAGDRANLSVAIDRAVTAARDRLDAERPVVHAVLGGAVLGGGGRAR